MINRIRILKDFLAFRTRVSGLPVEVGIEMTNRCNLKCKMCARETMTRPTGDMPLDLLKKIIDEISPYVEMVYLHGDGEPLLHPGIFEAIAYAREKGVKVGVSSNATLLDEERSHRLIEAAPDYLILAIDGATQETYEKIRINGRFDQVVANAQRFLELKKQKSSGIHTVLQFVRMAENAGEAQLFIDQWKKFQPDAIRIKACVDLLGGKAPTVFKRPCFYLWRQVMIDWDGTVFPCCVDTDSIYNLGNVSNQPLAEIWNGPALQQMRHKHVQKGLASMDLCRNCDMYQFTPVALLGATLIDGYRIKKYLPHWQALLGDHYDEETTKK